LFDVTPQHIHRPRSPSGGMMSLAGRWERGAMPPVAPTSKKGRTGANDRAPPPIVAAQGGSVR
jgi:hypothetical protein